MAHEGTLKRKIAAIMAADIAEYSRLISEDEEETLHRLQSYRDVFDDFVKKSGGRIFNTAGDAVMCEFASAVEATRCAIDIQESLRTRNMAFPPHRQMHFRIGISIGDIVERDGDLLGDGVNIAARLESLAVPGGICVSRNVHEAVTNKISVPFRDLGHREVKNLPHPVHAFQVDLGGKERVLGGAPIAARALKFSPLVLGAGALMIGGGLALGVFMLREKAPSAPREIGSKELASGDLAKAGTSVVVTEALSPAEAFAKLAQSGGIVREPKSAPEFYHNARSFEARGEAAAARRDYLALAKLETDHIDPYLRFAALLRAQDGRAGAREIFAGLAQGKSLAAKLVHLLQFEGAERQTRLIAFAADYPAYAPIHALLAQDFGEDRQNGQTLDDRRKELDYQQAFLEAERAGTLVPFFLDHSILAQWIDRAQKRVEGLTRFFALNKGVPQAQFMRTNSGWYVNVTLPEPAIEMSYQLPGMAAFRASGSQGFHDQRTGRPFPNLSIEMPAQTGKSEIAIRYKDANGVESAAHRIAFDPEIALIRGARDALERTSNSWLAFGSAHNAGLLYYSQLMSYRCAIERAEIGFGDDDPAQNLPIPACNPNDPHALPRDSLPYLRLPAGVKSVSLRLTFRGGDRSDIKRYIAP